MQKENHAVTLTTWFHSGLNFLSILRFIHPVIL
nr:MAG TPA: hypothetical protein [Caudoviricetes sp.]